MKTFNPDNVLIAKKNLFGLPFAQEESELVIIPVPWEVTVSFLSGASDGPKAVLYASCQVDFYDEDMPEAWKFGISMNPISESLVRVNRQLKKKSKKCISYLETHNNKPADEKLLRDWKKIDATCEKLRSWVKNEADKIIGGGRIAAVLGGEHSVPLGLLETLGEKYSSFGILHIDSHLDLRDAFCGFKLSHASAMRNAFQITAVKKIVNVGARDYCQEEAEFMKKSRKKIVAFTDREISKQKYEGKKWKEISRKIITQLPKNVYVSFDIDGLDPKLCPNTGTPVPGGLEFNEASYLLGEILRSGRKIIGFDLSEVAPASAEEDSWSGDWNAIVGSRILYRLSVLALKSKFGK